jgi:hypothetical protein
MSGEALDRMRAIEAQLLARRDGAPDPQAAVEEALAAVCGEAVPAEIAAAARATATAVEAHGAAFPPGAEPAYHDRYHQAEATLCAGHLAAEALRAGLLAPRAAALVVLAMAGHDLLHDGTAGEAPGALERRSAEATARLATMLPEADRAEVVRLILATAPDAAPDDLAGRMVREADLFASLTPDLGWRLSRALAAELRAARLPGAGIVASHAGRFVLLDRLPPMTPPAVALGQEATRQAQLAALRRAGHAACAAEGAERLDAMPPAEAGACWAAALAACGMPDLPA